MMPRSRIFRSTFLCVAAVVVHACARSDSAVSGDTSPARAGATTAASVATCDLDSQTALSGQGIGDLRVGAPVETVARSCRILRDTIAAGAEGLQERRIVVALARDSVTAVVDSNRVWRLHVRSPAFRTADSLGVGMPAAALRRSGARVLSGEGKVFVTLPSHCGLSFRLRGVEAGRVSSVAQIPANADVDEVLAFGCSAGRD
jgi:hypothetical protein